MYVLLQDLAKNEDECREEADALHAEDFNAIYFGISCVFCQIASG